MANTSTSTDGYKLLTTISLPGTVGGHGDIVTYDPTTDLVWLSQSPDHNVVAIDAATNTVRGVIPGLNNPNGIALTPQDAFLSDAGNNVDVIVDKNTFEQVGSVVATGAEPDGTTYVPSTGQVYVASDTANVEDALNTTAPFAQTASFALPPDPSPDGPDVSLYVPSTDLLYQPDQGQIDVIDPHTNAIVNQFPLLASGDTKPPVYDPVTNHLLVGTTNNQMLVVNATTGQLVSTIAISGSVDETTIDVGARLAFVGDKAGVVDVINLDTSTLAGDLPAEPGVHTLAVNPNDHDVYVYENNSNKVDVYGPASTVTSTGITPATVVNGVAQMTGTASQQATVQSINGDLTAVVNQTTMDAGSANTIAFADGSLYVGANSAAAQVIRLYGAVLGRAPDAGGLAINTSYIQSGGSAVSIAQSMLDSPEGKAVFATSAQTPSGFVNQVYQNVLHRPAEAAGLNGAVTALDNGLTQAQYVTTVAASPEAQTDTASQINSGVWIENSQGAEVQGLYYAALNRAPDAAGLVDCINALNAGASIQLLAQDIVGSTEFANLYGGLSNSALVAAMYQGVLGRAPDAGPASAYTSALDSGSLTKGGLVLGFSQSAEREALNIGSQGTGLTRVVAPS